MKTSQHGNIRDHNQFREHARGRGRGGRGIHTMANSQVPQEPPDPGINQPSENTNNRHYEEFDNRIFDTCAIDVIDDIDYDNRNVTTGFSNDTPQYVSKKTMTGTKISKYRQTSGLCFIILAICMTLLSFVGNVNVTTPMICKTDHPVANFRVPKLSGCDLKRSHTDLHASIDQNVTLFKPNLIQYKSKTHHFNIVRTDITTHAGFFGENRNRTTTHTNELVTMET